MTRDEFLDECRFAKVVKASYENAVLIGGHVFFVSGPNERTEDAPDWAEWFVEALRNTAVADPAMKAQGASSAKLA